MTDTLQAVVTLPYGTGTAAFAGFGIPVAGKSGTAESGAADPHAWFPAYAPADDPTISVATVLPYIPLGTGGADAAPLVRRVMADALRELGGIPCSTHDRTGSIGLAAPVSLMV